WRPLSCGGPFRGAVQKPISSDLLTTQPVRLAFEPGADASDRRRLAACGTSASLTCSWEAFPALLLPPFAWDAWPAPCALEFRLARPDIPSAGDKVSVLPCFRSAGPWPRSPRSRGHRYLGTECSWAYAC